MLLTKISTNVSKPVIAITTFKQGPINVQCYAVYLQEILILQKINPFNNGVVFALFCQSCQ
jgi:hypothetical protein